MKKRKPTILQNPFGPSRKDIDIFVDTLNGTDEESEEARKLFARLRASGPNLKKMCHSDEELWRDLQEAVFAQWFPSGGARAYLVPLPRSGDHYDTPVGRARSKFAMFVLHPDCDKVGGPCEICGRFWKQGTRHRTKYCTRKCASLASAPAAIQSTEDRREAAHKRRINWAREAMTTWSSKTRVEGWESWTLRHINEQEASWNNKINQPEPRPVTVKSLTRWVNSNELQKPSTKKVRERK